MEYNFQIEFCYLYRVSSGAVCFKGLFSCVAIDGEIRSICLGKFYIKQISFAVLLTPGHVKQRVDSTRIEGQAVNINRCNKTDEELGWSRSVGWFLDCVICYGYLNSEARDWTVFPSLTIVF